MRIVCVLPLEKSGVPACARTGFTMPVEKTKAAAARPRAIVDGKEE